MDDGIREKEQYAESVDSIMSRFESELPKFEQSHKNELFHATIAADNQALAQQFLDLGADINSLNDYGQTALFYSVVQNKGFGHDSTTMITELLEKGARPNVKNRTGETALSACRSPEIIKLLISHGAVVINEPDNATILHTLVTENNLTLVKFFAPKVDVNQINEEGNTAFDIAIEGNQVSFAEILAANGAKCSFETLEAIIEAGHVAMFRIAVSTIGDNTEMNTWLVDLVQEGHPGMRAIMSDAYQAMEAKHAMEKSESVIVTDVVIDAVGECAGAGMGMGPDGTVQIAGAHDALTGANDVADHADD